jgi:hypothetical protein
VRARRRAAGGAECPSAHGRWLSRCASKDVAGASAGSGRPERRTCLRAIDLARTSGATFLVGVATVGLHSVRASAGRVHEALGGYRDAIEYFARNGNWTHLWTALRNLADLLRRLGDDEPAALIDAAADQAHQSD